MKTLLSLLVLPLVALAQSYTVNYLPYSDAPTDLPTAIAVSYLTERGVLHGNPDGTFRAETLLNRAEYMQIVMGLVPNPAGYLALNCFPDVDEGAWYAHAVCKGKVLQVVRGNAIDGVPANQWRFEPSRSVQYEEAVKVLFGIFGLPVPSMTMGEWYERYLRQAEKIGIDLPGIVPGQALTRGEMSRLVVSFIAYSNGELSQLRAAESGEEASSSVAVSSSSSASLASSASSASSSSSVIYDPNDDVSMSDSFLLLGDTTSVLASANIFMNSEPLDVTAIVVNLVSATSTIESFAVYDHDGVFIGKAYLDASVAGNTQYRLSLRNGSITIPMRQEYSLYVRGILKGNNSGGTSGESVEVASLGVEGDGVWSNHAYTETSTDTFDEHQTALSGVSGITNAGAASAPLVGGPGQEIGVFRFSGQRSDSSASLYVTDLTFQISQVGGITLSNVVLENEGHDQHACTVGTSTITCSSMPASFASFGDSARVIRVFGDVTIPSGLTKASLQLSLNDAGSISSPGSVTWTDGTTSFSWVEGGNPVAQGTYYSY